LLSKAYRLFYYVSVSSAKGWSRELRDYPKALWSP
jgi:hypothetical protein